ncbi:MAG: 50S ribosomal protein L31 [Flavobacteriales bacterium]
MKKGIHPENYRMVAFKDMSNEDVFLTRSTVDTKETLEVDGVEYPLVKLEISRNLRTSTKNSRSNLFRIFKIFKTPTCICWSFLLFLFFYYFKV